MSIVSTIALGAGTLVGAASGAAFTGAIATGIAELIGPETTGGSFAETVAQASVVIAVVILIAAPVVLGGYLGYRLIKTLMG